MFYHAGVVCCATYGTLFAPWGFVDTWVVKREGGVLKLLEGLCVSKTYDCGRARQVVGQ